MFRTLTRQTLGLLACAALVAFSAAAAAQVVQLPPLVIPVQIIGAPGCTSWTPGGSPTAPTLTCNTGGPTPFSCSIIGAPSGTVAANTPVSLTMSCSGGTPGYTYSWSPVAGTSATLQTTVAATTTYTATATDNAVPAATSQKSVTVTVGGGGGGGGPINCAANGSVTGGTVVIEGDWNNFGNPHTTGLGANDAVVVHFTTGPSGSGNLDQIGGAEYGSPTTGRYMTLSSTPCDFAQPPALGWRATLYGSSGSIPFCNTTGLCFGGVYPALSPNTSYYLNVRSDAACGGNCNMFFSLTVR